jgi:hypothetical protein
MSSLPAVMTHRYHPARGIGGNICDLPQEKAERILHGLRAMGRGLRPDYLRKRLRVEDWLIAAKNEKLGRTPLTRPVYFFLGNFADGEDPSRPAALVMPLAAFPPGSLTFTYADSMTSYQMGIVAADHRSGRERHYGQVFTHTEIEAVVATLGVSRAQWEIRSGEWRDLFLEVQVWDDAPIHKWLATTAGSSVPINRLRRHGGIW